MSTLLKRTDLKTTLKTLFKQEIVNMSVFTKKTNLITGETNWIIQNENYDFYQEISRSAFADMLHDEERNDKYFLAIKSAIEHTRKKGKKTVVLDIGTGTGLLSMMAAKCGADHIYACEAFSPIAKCAVEVVKNNGFSDRIKVIDKRSTELTVGPGNDIPFKANILVAEVFDTELIGEGALPTFSHAVKHLLEEDCIVVPSFGTIYAQVVESDFLQSWNKLNPIECKPGQFIELPGKYKTCEGHNSVHDIQMNQLDRSLFKSISEPEAVLRFDWSGKTIPLTKNGCNTKTVVAQRSGTAQVVLMWWDLTMDVAGDITLSCAPWWAHPDKPSRPSEIPWRDHWLQAIYYLPQPLPVREGQQFQLVSSHDEYSLWFHAVSASEIRPENASYPCPVCKCGFNLISRTRIGMLNDNHRRLKYLKAVQRLVSEESVVVTFGDGCFLGLQAALFGAKKVYCVEENRVFYDIVEDFINHNKLDSKVQLLRSSTLDDKLKSEINLVLAEPYFQNAVLPWETLRLWYLLKQFNGSSVTVMPQCITFWALPLQLDHLYKIRQPVRNIHGFKINVFDKLIDKSSKISDDSEETQPLWEYPGVALSKPKQIAMFDMTSAFPSDIVATSSQIEFESCGRCNGIALWLDFNLDGQNIVSQGPVNSVVSGEYVTWDMHTRQGVHFLSDLPQVSAKDRLYVKVSFSPNSGEVRFTFDLNKSS